MSGGSMPGVCDRCHAYLVPGRADCPFCGAEAEVAAARVAAAQPPAPGSSREPRLPRSWLPSRPPELQDSEGSGVDSRWLLKVIAAIIAIAGIAAAFAFMPDPGHKPAPAAVAGSEPDRPAPLDDLLGVCKPVAVPVERAKAFDGKPGRHRVEAVRVNPDGRWPDVPSRRIALPAGWSSPTDDDDVRLEEVELVGCYIVTGARLELRCQAEGGATQELWVMSGRLVVREAKTGREVLRQELPEQPTGQCPATPAAEGGRVYGFAWEFQVTNVLRAFRGEA